MSEDLQRQLNLARRQLEAVQRVSAALYSVTNTDALLRQALETASEVVEADAGSILLYNADNNTLVFKHAVGPVAATLIGQSLDLSFGRGIAGEVFRTGRGRITPDVRADPNHIGTMDERVGYHTHSLMTVPLNTGNGAALGVIQLVNKRVGDFDDGDMAVIEIVSSLVTMSLQNALLAQEARLAAIARSVGEISHDIGNMLTYVSTPVQTLEYYIADVRDGKPGAIDALQAFYGEVRENVEDGVQQALTRTREIASAMKGEVAPPVFRPGRPLEAAQRVAHSLSGPALRVGVRLTVQGSADLEAILDSHRLYNALYNLVNNALVETPAGGAVTVTVSPEDNPDFYTLAVADTGSGMSEEALGKIFTDAMYTTKSGGTGLGTRIVRRFVEQHGGTISVISAPGRGTTITLRLPKNPPAAREAEA